MYYHIYTESQACFQATESYQMGTEAAPFTTSANQNKNTLK